MTTAPYLFLVSVVGCELEFSRLEKVLKELIENNVEARVSLHECEVHGDKGMCDEHESYMAGVNENEKELSEVLKDLNQCIQRLVHK